MQVSLSPGRYIIAVSGGVDSVVLLDALRQLPDVELIVAHVDHGIRPDSFEDAKLVHELAQKCHLPFETTSLALGPNTAESVARDKRYEWLEATCEKYGADAIVTAHHQNDVIETVIINMMRGTGWRGLASLRETSRIHRPFLDVSKIDIVTYAIDHDLQWREDSTNDDVRYLRNYVRHGILPRLDSETVRRLVDLYHAQCELRDEIEAESARIVPSASQNGELFRYWLIMLPDEVARELLHGQFGSLTRAQSARLIHFARTAKIGALLELTLAQTYRAHRRTISLNR